MEQEKTEASEKELLLRDAGKFEKSPWVFLIRKSKLTYLIIIFLLIFGLVTIGQLPKELNPEVEIPIAVVVTAFPGASPADVEEQVTKEIEAQIEELSGVKRIDSTSSLGASSIVVEFEAGEDLVESIRKLRDSVSRSERDLPDDATQPQVVEISVDDQAILVTTFSSSRYDLADLKKFADDMRDRLKSIPFVSDVRVVGGQERVVRVDVDQQRIAEKGISMGEIIGAIAANNVNFPVGSLEIDDLRYSVRVAGKFISAEEVANLRIASVSGRPLFLEDVASVREDFTEETSKSRLSVGGSEPTEAVSIQIFKKTGGDITKVTAQAREQIEQAKGRIYPEDLEVEITRDFSVYIEDSINTLSSNGMGTIVIILILLFIFLGLKEALIAGLAVPFSFFVAFIAMALLDESLNGLSLFSLVLALGLLVDSAIVVVESMYEKVSKYRMSGYWAAISTIQEYAAPLLSGMLTTVAAFFPLLFVKGIFGEFMRTIPVVVTVTLIAALFVSITIVPSIGALFMNPLRRDGGSKRGLKGLFKSKPRAERWASKIFSKYAAGYKEVLSGIVRNSRNRKTLIFGAWILFFISVLLPVFGFLNVQSFPTDDQDFFYVDVELPNGTAIGRTDEIVKKAEDILRQESQVANFVSSSGVSFSLDLGAQSSGGQENKGSIEVNLVKKEEREETSVEIAQRVRKKLKAEITQADVEVIEAASGPPTGDPIQLRVVGEDLLVLEELAEKIKAELEQIPTTINIGTSVQLSSGELVFRPDKDLLAEKGFSVAQIGSEIRSGISRDIDSKIIFEGDETVIDVGYEEDRISTINALEGIELLGRSGEKTALSELGEIRVEPSLAAISRRDGERVVTISAGTEGGNPSKITEDLKERIARNVPLPSGYVVSYGGEQEELQEVFMDMFMKMIIGIILILFILVAQFNSYKQVAMILFTIPLAMIGVFWGMTLGRLTLDIPSFVGIVSLTGIVVNNAIILIDQMNKERKKGHDIWVSVEEAGLKRFRPIILTTITTIFGLMPLSIAQPFWRNMGFAIIFGLAFSTLLTLFIIPAMYVSFHKKDSEVDAEQSA